MPLRSLRRAAASGSRRPHLHTLRQLALCLALIPGLVPTAALAAAPAPQAEPSGQTGQDLRDYRIPAGPLAPALTRFIGESGILLASPSALTQGRNSPGLEGRYGIAAGLGALLRGTGLEAQRQGDGTYQLRQAGTAAAAAPQAGAADAGAGAEPVVLQQVQVTAESASAKTENSGSYTTRAVTLGKSEHSLLEIPQSVSVITRQRMDDQNITRIDDALQQTTGITVAVNDNPYLNNQYYARGYTLSSELDGIPSTGSLNVGAPQFDLAMYDRIEVVRGSAALLEGSGEPGGLVNFARKRPTAAFHVDGSASVGSWSDYHSDLDVTGGLDASGSLRGRAVVAGTDRDFFYAHSHNRSGMFYGILEYDLGPATLLSLSGTIQRDETQGILSALPAYTDGRLLNLSPKANPFPDWTMADQTTKEGFAELDHFFDNDWRMRASLRYRTSATNAKYAGVYGGIDPASGDTNYFPAADTTTFKWAAADINASGPLHFFGRIHQLLVGANFDQLNSRDSYSNAPSQTIDFFQIEQLPEPAVPPAGDYKVRTVQYGFYSQLKLQLLDPLSLIVGGRISHYQQYVGIGAFGADLDMPQSPGGVDHRVTPYAGLIYALDRHVSLYGSYSQIFVPQAQLTASGAPLPPRTGDQYEAGAKGEFMNGRLNVSAALFKLRDRNRAYYSSDTFFYSAAGEVDLDGAEAEISGSPLRGWDLTAGYTYLHPRYQTDQDQAALSAVTPKHNFKLWSNYRFHDNRLEGLNLGAGLLASSSLVSGNVDVPGYAVASAQAGYQIDRHWNASLSVNNLLDHVYYQTFNSSGGYYGEPRNVMLTLRAKY